MLFAEECEGSSRRRSPPRRERSSWHLPVRASAASVNCKRSSHRILLLILALLSPLLSVTWKSDSTKARLFAKAYVAVIPRRRTSLQSTSLCSVSPKYVHANGKKSTETSPSLSSSNVYLNGNVIDGETIKQQEDDENIISSSRSTPRHVALICDGNSRWAKARNLPAAAGHAAGAERLIQVLRALRDTKTVTHCTLYAFSTENWQRPANEIRDIWTVMEQTAKRLYNSILEEDMILRVVGDLSDERIPASLREILQKLEQETLTKSMDHGNSASGTVTLCLAINYGGRQDILNASKRLATLIADGTVDPDSGVTEETFAACLDTANVPDPDLIIRTSGEKRLSNFLLWNAAYAELYFTDTLWPDFGAASVRDALDWFSKRRRRFGGHNDDGQQEDVR